MEAPAPAQMEAPEPEPPEQPELVELPATQSLRRLDTHGLYAGIIWSCHRLAIKLWNDVIGSYWTMVCFNCLPAGQLPQHPAPKALKLPLLAFQAEGLEQNWKGVWENWSIEVWILVRFGMDVTAWSWPVDKGWHSCGRNGYGQDFADHLPHSGRSTQKISFNHENSKCLPTTFENMTANKLKSFQERSRAQLWWSAPPPLWCNGAMRSYASLSQVGMEVERIDGRSFFEKDELVRKHRSPPLLWQWQERCIERLDGRKVCFATCGGAHHIPNAWIKL